MVKYFRTIFYKRQRGGTNERFGLPTVHPKRKFYETSTNSYFNL